MKTFKEFISEMGKLGPIVRRKKRWHELLPGGDLSKKYSLRTYQGLEKYSANTKPEYVPNRDPSAKTNRNYGDNPAPQGPPNVVRSNMPIVGGEYVNPDKPPGGVIQNPGLKNRKLKWLFLSPKEGGTGLEV